MFFVMMSLYLYSHIILQLFPVVAVTILMQVKLTHLLNFFPYYND